MKTSHFDREALVLPHILKDVRSTKEKACIGLDFIRIGVGRNLTTYSTER
jgi:hypothetical protein